MSVYINMTAYEDHTFDIIYYYTCSINSFCFSIIEPNLSNVIYLNTISKVCILYIRKKKVLIDGDKLSSIIKKTKIKYGYMWL